MAKTKDVVSKGERKMTAAELKRALGMVTKIANQKAEGYFLVFLTKEAKKNGERGQFVDGTSMVYKTNRHAIVATTLKAINMSYEEIAVMGMLDTLTKK